ncbi:MAG TPA: hypothetical protein VE078_00965 [Thermoanaerobaculia bacterium]|nr:hypothetical protein [Thermoanaerobaculia bacterium]
MSWVRRTLGLDAVDLILHLGVTLALMAWVAMANGPEEMLPVLTGASLVVLGIRRHVALSAMERRGLTGGEMAAERIAELEQRMEELEAAQARVAELEERLDFTERLLARSAEPRPLGPGGAR